MTNTVVINAYAKGKKAYLNGRAFKSNPYKDPDLSTNWSVGWMDARKWHNQERAR